MRLRHLQSLGSASLGLAAATLCASFPSPAQAAGLVGAFAPEKWTLNRYFVSDELTYGAPFDTFSGTVPGVPPDDFLYSYGCGSDPTPEGLLGTSACVAISNFGSQSSPASFRILGTSSNEVPGTSPNSLALNTDGTRTLVEWSLVYSGPDVLTTFGFQFQSTGAENEILGYFNLGSTAFQFNPVSPNATYNASSNMGSIQPESFLVSNGDVLRFGVYTAATTGALGQVSITGFDAQPVPAPLPLLGAGAAFGWSRRLRRRVRAQAGVAVR